MSEDYLSAMAGLLKGFERGFVPLRQARYQSDLLSQRRAGEMEAQESSRRTIAGEKYKRDVELADVEFDREKKKIGLRGAEQRKTATAKQKVIQDFKVPPFAGSDPDLIKKAQDDARGKANVWVRTEEGMFSGTSEVDAKLREFFDQSLKQLQMDLSKKELPFTDLRITPPGQVDRFSMSSSTPSASPAPLATRPSTPSTRIPSPRRELTPRQKRIRELQDELSRRNR